MAGLRVGTDLIEVQTVADAIRTFGERYLARVFTPNERAYCESIERRGGDSVPHFAARFAAKEAVMKVLRPAPSDALVWKSIEVVRSPKGFCTVRLRDDAKRLARRAGLGRLAVSLSHEERFATATAVAVSGRRPKSARGRRLIQKKAVSR